MSYKNYRPLPPEVTIGKSPIEGLGVIAIVDIQEGEFLGISHVYDDSGNFQDNYVRTPLGGFLNHSDSENAKIITLGNYRLLKVIEDISEGQEVTVNYSKSDCGKSYSFIN